MLDIVQVRRSRAKPQALSREFWEPVLDRFNRGRPLPQWYHEMKAPFVHDTQKHADGFGDTVLTIKRFATGRITASTYTSLKGGTRLGGKFLTANALFRPMATLVNKSKVNAVTKGFSQDEHGVVQDTRFGDRWHMCHKRTQFTSRAKKWLLDAGAVIERISKSKALFFTATLPGSTDEAMSTLANLSGVVINRLTQFMRRSKSLRDYLYVWEWQGRGALHLHLCVATKTDEEHAIASKTLRDAWLKILREISAETGVDMFARKAGGTWKDDACSHACDAVVLTEGAARYVAKYTTKGSKAAAGEKVGYPGRWYAVSYQLRRKVEAERETVTFIIPRDEDGVKVMMDICDTASNISEGVRLYEPTTTFPLYSASICPWQRFHWSTFWRIVESAFFSVQSLWSDFGTRFDEKATC